jgi:hypothetical protein
MSAPTRRAVIAVEYGRTPSRKLTAGAMKRAAVSKIAIFARRTFNLYIGPEEKTGKGASGEGAHHRLVEDPQ